MNNNLTVWGAPVPEAHTICCTSHWLNPKEEWRMINLVSSVCKPVAAFETMQESPPPSLCLSYPPDRDLLSSTKKRDAIALKNMKTTPSPLWKRRGAKALPSLQLHPVIRGDTNWLEKAEGKGEFLQIVNDSEWTSIHPNYFEVHSLQDVEDGIVIDPPTYPSWYTVPSTNSKVPALLPFTSEMLLRNALDENYNLDRLIYSMGNAIAEYSVALIHKKRRTYQEVLILARQRSWQGASAIAAATRILNNWIRVSVYILGERDDQGAGRRDTKEEDEFIAAGGSVYRNLQDLAGRKFRVVVVALEDQYSGTKTNLSLYGELLQHSVVVFVDPPVLKCSYSTALQIATNGCYNISQKTLLLVPCLPKAYVADNFIEMLVVDVGIPQSVQQATTGINEVIFPQVGNDPLNPTKVVSVVPVEFTVRGSRLYFYRNGQRVPC